MVLNIYYLIQGSNNSVPQQRAFSGVIISMSAGGDAPPRVGSLAGGRDGDARRFLSCVPRAPVEAVRRGDGEEEFYITNPCIRR